MFSLQNPAAWNFFQTLWSQLCELLPTAWEMLDRYTGAPTTAELSARAGLSLLLGSFCPESLRPGTLSPPRSDRFGGRSLARTGSPGGSRCRLFPTSHIWPLGIIPGGTTSGTPKTTAMFYSERTSFHNSTSLQGAGRWGRGQSTSPESTHPTPTSVTLPSRAHILSSRKGERTLRSPESRESRWNRLLKANNVAPDEPPKAPPSPRVAPLTVSNPLFGGSVSINGLSTDAVRIWLWAALRKVPAGRASRPVRRRMSPQFSG